MMRAGTAWAAFADPGLGTPRLATVSRYKGRPARNYMLDGPEARNVTNQVLGKLFEGNTPHRGR